MTELLSAKRWRPATYKIPGGDCSVSMELKRLTVTEANELARAMRPAWEVSRKSRGDNNLLVAAMEASKDIESLSPDELRAQLSLIDQVAESNARAVNAMFDELAPAYIDRVFRGYVRAVSADFTDDGDAIDSGERLLGVADADLVLWLLLELRRNASLSSIAGKASGSPSGSLSTKPATREPSASIAPPTEPGDGIASSIAMPPQDGNGQLLDSA